MRGARIDRGVVFELADLDRPRWQHQVLVGDGVEHIDRRDALCLHLTRHQIDHHLTRFAAKRIGHDGTRHGHELRSQEVLTEVIELLLRQAFARQPKLKDWHA